MIPAAQRAIEQREDMGVKLLNSVEITKEPIPLSDDARIEACGALSRGKMLTRGWTSFRFSSAG